jgi:hypothetical protein
MHSWSMERGEYLLWQQGLPAKPRVLIGAES